MSVGPGSLTFEAVPGWGDIPDEAGLLEAIVFDSKVRVLPPRVASRPGPSFRCDSYPGMWSVSASSARSSSNAAGLFHSETSLLRL